MLVYVCTLSIHACSGQKHQVCVELGLQAVLSCLVCMLEQLGSSTRTTRGPNPCSSPVHTSDFKISCAFVPSNPGIICALLAKYFSGRPLSKSSAQLLIQLLAALAFTQFRLQLYLKGNLKHF